MFEETENDFPPSFPECYFWSWEVGIVCHTNICFWIIERKNQPFQKWQDYLKFCSHQAGGTAEERNGWARSCSLDCCHCPHECDCRWNVPGFGRVLRTLVITMPELWGSNYYHLKRRVGFHPKGRNSDHLSQAKGFPDGSDGNAGSACNSGDPDSIPGSGRSPGERNGYPLQYSCLENSMDRRAWQATVHGIAKNWTQLSD